MIYASLEFENDRVGRIYASARYPSRQAGNVFFDSDEVPNLRNAEELPLKVNCFYSLVAFRASHILLSRDVIGGRPLYYGRTAVSSFKTHVDGEVSEVLPGEVLKLDYSGEVIERRKYAFEDVFKLDYAREGLIEELEEEIGKAKLGFACVAFSGGIDSALLAAIYDLPLVSVTASRDEEEWVKEAAKKLGKELEIWRVEEEDVIEALEVVRKVVETEDFLQLSIAVPVHLTMQFAKSLGYSEIVFGQGADELFGGYKRYEGMSAYELEEALIRDLKEIGERNLVRDAKLAYRNEIKLVTPYLRWDVIRAALKIPPEQKVRREGGKVIRKFVLRKIAEKYLPGEIAWREKRAIQYSTGISKILKKFA